MNPDATPLLPPVLPGFSEPRFGELEVKAKTEAEYNDVAGADPGDPDWTVGYYGHNSDMWHSLRLGSPIALANGIGVEAKPEAEQIFTCPASRHVAMMAEELDEHGRYVMFEEDPKHCAGSMRATVGALWKTREELAAGNSEISRITRDKEEAKDSYGSSSFEAARLQVELTQANAAVEKLSHLNHFWTTRYSEMDRDTLIGECVARAVCRDAEIHEKEELEAELAILKTTPPAPDGWRGITSALRDGTHIQLWAGDEWVHRAYWDIGKQGWIRPNGGYFVVGPITHWMPLPKPPVGKGDA